MKVYFAARLKTFSRRNKDCCRKQKAKPQKSEERKEFPENRFNFRREYECPTIVIPKDDDHYRQTSSMKEASGVVAASFHVVLGN